MKLFAFTLDLETDFAGFMDKDEIFKDLDKIETVLSALNSLDAKLTVFTVGNIFELYPEVIKLFEQYNCEFEPHSYSHDFNNADSEYEIKMARTAYYNYFKKYPIGYRSPRGKITNTGIKTLEKEGFLYDSSVFPSFFPNPFRYLFHNRQVHYHDNSDILEIPITSVNPFYLTLSVSYLKLFGVDFFITLSRYFSLPDIICFDSHLHDFIHIENSYDNLSKFWKLIYGRNKLKGTEYCIRFLKHVKKMGYQFCYMSEIYDLYKKPTNDLTH
jgi:hypothetical protein